MIARTNITLIFRKTGSYLLVLFVKVILTLSPLRKAKNP